MSLKPLMFMGQIQAFEREGTKHIVDRLWAGGIRQLVLGDLILSAGETRGPSFAPDLSFYEGIARKPPELPAELTRQSQIFGDAVKAAADKGYQLFFHDWGSGPAGCLNDPEQLRFGLARTRETFARYPETHGFVLDGPEWGYEIEPEHRSDVFKCFCEHCQRKARDLGYDLKAIEAAAQAMKARLRQLSPEVMRGFMATQSGPFDALDLLLQEPVLFDWLRFKTESIQHYVGAHYTCIKEMGAHLQLACGPRLAAFAPLTGYNFRRLSEVTDFICPKLYFWQHGIDGLKGTVYRYAQTLMDLNTGVSEALALDFVFKLFGFTMPGVSSLETLSQPLNREFFEQTVPGEIAKMIYRTGEVARLKPWVGLHHGGVRISSGELSQLLGAIAGSGLQSLIYWHYSDMTEDEWKILQGFIS